MYYFDKDHLFNKTMSNKPQRIMVDFPMKCTCGWKGMASECDWKPPDEDESFRTYYCANPNCTDGYCDEDASRIDDYVWEDDGEPEEILFRTKT